MLIEDSMSNDAIGKLMTENLRLTDQLRKTAEALAELTRIARPKSPQRA